MIWNTLHLVILVSYHSPLSLENRTYFFAVVGMYVGNYFLHHIYITPPQILNKLCRKIACRLCLLILGSGYLRSITEVICWQTACRFPCGSGVKCQGHRIFLPIPMPLFDNPITNFNKMWKAYCLLLLVLLSGVTLVYTNLF